MWEEKYICHHCVNEVYIQNEIYNSGNTENECSYCNEKIKNISIEELTAKVDEMLDNHYEIAGHDYRGEPTGDDLSNIIQEQLDVEYNVASDIIESLYDQFNDHNEESKYSEEYTYSPINWHISPLNQKWEEISNSLLTEARFFNSGAKTFLDELFSDINIHSDTVIKKLNIDEPLFRARVFNDAQAIEKALTHPEAELGPPPSILATPGRMNAHGVPVFYGSTSPNIAIAEVRPAVGSSVIVATFYPLRELRILDLSAFKSLSHSRASRFDPEGLVERDKILFLRTLSNKLTIPVLGQAKGHEYLITQAVSEYLGLLQNCKLDGISFESTQVNSKQNDKNELNIVLFSKSAKVAFANNDFKQRKYEVELYDCEWEDDHEPFNIFSPRITLSVNEFNSKSLVNYNREHHGVIRLDEKSLEIHIVEGVVYKKKTYPIKFSEHLIPSENKGDDAMDF